jgi:hypothetical protein
MAVAEPLPVVPARRPAQRDHLLVHDLLHHLQASADGEGQQPLLR